MPAPTGLISKLAYAVICGVVVFLIVLAIGLLIVHFVTSPDGTDYGNTVKGLAVLLGVLYAVYVFFSGGIWPHRGTPAV
jgi:hypothetical protein